MTHRRQFLIQTALAAGSLVVARPLKAISSASTPGEFQGKISIADISGLYTRWNSATAAYGNSDEIKSLKKRLQYAGDMTLLLGSGNNIDTGNLAGEDHDKQMQALKALGFDALVPGHSDIAGGKAYYEKLAGKHNFGALCTHTNQTLLPHQILHRGNFKIGIIGNSNPAGLVSSTDQNIAAISGLLNSTADDLREVHGCNLVLCMQFNKQFRGISDVELAGSSRNIDIFISQEKHVADKLYIARNALKHEVIVSFPSERAQRIQLTYNNKLEKTGIALIPLDS